MALIPAKDFLAQRASITPRLCGCNCGKPLEPRVDGERKMLGGKEVNDDCYYARFSDELEDFPILPPRLRRGR